MLNRLDEEYQAITGLPSLLLPDWVFVMVDALKAHGKYVPLMPYHKLIEQQYGQKAAVLFETILQVKADIVCETATQPTPAEMKRAGVFVIKMSRDEINQLTVELSRIDPKNSPAVAAFNDKIYKLIKEQSDV